MFRILCVFFKIWNSRLEGWKRNTELHLYGEAGRVLAAGAGAVSSCREGSRAGALGRLHHVVVYPLSPLHQQVGQAGVQRDVAVVGEEHLLRHQPHLERQNSNVLEPQQGDRVEGEAAAGS